MGILCTRTGAIRLILFSHFSLALLSSSKLIQDSFPWGQKWLSPCL